jgi:LmbE family N-acetylglucosaminyl deacetylase
VPVRLLTLLAHPRDAAVLCGGTLARYADRGAEVIALSTTRGEAQPVVGPSAGTDDLAELRARELYAAGGVLGVRDIVLLDYPDGGLEALDPEILEDLYFDLIRAVGPAVVVTSGREGPEDDPDHRAVHAAATGAFFRARGSAGSPGSVPAKLYYSVWPERHGRRALQALAAQGVPTAAIPGMRGTIESAAEVTTIVDIRATLSRKLQAVRAHASQADPALEGVDPAQLDDLWGQEFFTRAFPHPWITGVIERDLLAGLPPAAPAQRLAS